MHAGLCPGSSLYSQLVQLFCGCVCAFSNGEIRSKINPRVRTGETSSICLALYKLGRIIYIIISKQKEKHFEDNL